MQRGAHLMFLCLWLNIPSLPLGWTAYPDVHTAHCEHRMSVCFRFLQSDPHLNAAFKNLHGVHRQTLRLKVSGTYWLPPRTLNGRNLGHDVRAASGSAAS